MPNADLEHDRFHISKYLNKAVDVVRRKGSHQLNKAGDRRLFGSKYVWLHNPEKMREQQQVGLNELMKKEFKIRQAWVLKTYALNLLVAWGCADAGNFFFEYRSKRVDEVGLAPLTKVKKLLQRHFDNVLTDFNPPITNAVSEGLNSNIQIIKVSARGFHRFERYRNRILFYCGKLNTAIAS